MTTRSAFSDDEWDLITLTPIAVGLAVAKAGRSGLLGSIRETKTLHDTVGHADQAYPDDELIRAVLAENRYPTNELIRAAIATALEYNLERASGEIAKSAEALALAATEDCAEVIALLRAKATPDESDDYQQWLLDIGRRVSRAATEHRTLVSEAETDLIGRLAAALDAPSGD